MRRFAGVLAVAALTLVPPVASATVQKAGKFRYVSKAAEVPAGTQAERAAKCPHRTSAVGGGAYTTGGSLEDEVASSAPFDGGDRDRRPDDGWISEVNAGPADRTMTTYAICTRIDGLRYIAKEGHAEPGQRGSAFARCAKADEGPVGGGVWTRGRSTAVTLAQTVRDFTPTGARFGWRGSVNNATAKRRGFTVWAICRHRKLRNTSDSQTTASDAIPGQHDFFVDCFRPDPEDNHHLMTGESGIDGGLQGEIASLLPADDGTDTDAVPDDGWTSWFNNETGATLRRQTGAFCKE